MNPVKKANLANCVCFVFGFLLDVWLLIAETIQIFPPHYSQPWFLYFRNNKSKISASWNNSMERSVGSDLN